ncbi:MAG: putative peptide zinc metalloprotease protein [Candidatus Eremiobacteraeota bacterium]|nr:putative peptide zinc metalloprotease protein [Candidatus Eremiobacteraeota bacterium]
MTGRKRVRLDTAERTERYVYRTRGGATLSVSNTALRLLEHREEGLDNALIAAEFTSAAGRTVTVVEVEAAFAVLNERIGKIEERAQQLPPGFLWRMRLLPEQVVAAIASRLRFMYAPWVAALVVPLALGLIAAALVRDGVTIAVDRPTFWIGYVVFVASLLVHELGHATAAERFGARANDIGAALYLIYPALYTDVTAAWALPRARRVIVDLGGVYFQSCAAAACLVLAHFLRADALHVAALMMLFACAISLTPFFRSDGYWLVADALGVPQLERSAIDLLRALAGRPRRPGAASYARPVIAATTVYAALTLILWTAAAWFLGRAVLAAFGTLPGVVARLGAGGFGLRHAADPADVHTLVNALVVTLFVAGLLIRSRRRKPKDAP